MTSFTPNSTILITTTEMHTAGEPVRIIDAGFPEIKGETLLEKRRYTKNNLDRFRKLLMLEPRGHTDMYGAILIEPDHPDAHIAVLFIQNEGYSTMCGHATIALARYAVDNGLIQCTNKETQVNIQCPCGLVRTTVAETGHVSFLSVPSFAFLLDFSIDVPKIGDLTVDIGYGGAYYAIVSAQKLNIDLNKITIAALAEIGNTISAAVKKSVVLTHPLSDELAFLYGTIIADGKDEYSQEPTKNVCVFADQQVDRSPTGSGVTARIAIQYARKLIKLGQKRMFRSCIDTEFTGTPYEEVQCGEFRGVIVQVEGKAFYTGKNTYYLEKDDILPAGFLLK